MTQLSDSPLRTALVIGASKGIGYCTARRFVSAGFAVAGTHRGSGVPENVHGIEADVKDESSIVAAFKEARTVLGGIGVVVYSAGIVRQDLLIRMQTDDLREVLDTNLVGAFISVRESLRIMMKQQAGSIVLISSESSRTGIPGAAHYTASKAGLEGLMRSAMWEAGPFSVRINVVAPGATDTEMLQKVSDDNLKSLIAMTPLQRIASPDEVAESVYQISQMPHVTGVMHPVTGGEGLGY